MYEYELTTSRFIFLRCVLIFVELSYNWTVIYSNTLYFLLNTNLIGMSFKHRLHLWISQTIHSHYSILVYRLHCQWYALHLRVFLME